MRGVSEVSKISRRPFSPFVICSTKGTWVVGLTCMIERKVVQWCMKEILMFQQYVLVSVFLEEGRRKWISHNALEVLQQNQYQHLQAPLNKVGRHELSNTLSNDESA